MITVTENAIEKLKSIASKEGLELRIRAKVIGGGCAGFQYDLYFDELEETSFDDVIVCDGIKFMIDQVSNQYLEGTVIDYVKKDFAEGFKFSNPNVTATCGCGSSFKP